MNITSETNLITEIDRFREWADRSFPGGRSGEWECDYDHWDDLYDAVLKYVTASPPEAWPDEVLQAILYGVARDNESEHLAEEIRLRQPSALIVLAKAALAGGERDAKWQLAEQLGHLRGGGEAERLLLLFACDKDEYVRRRALGALVNVGSEAVERLAIEAWHRPDEHQEWARMMALDCLNRIGSPLLDHLLEEAQQDERQYLRDFSKRIRQGIVA
jgi:hypothetical protein